MSGKSILPLIALIFVPFLLYCQDQPHRYYNIASAYYEDQQYDSALINIDLAISGYIDQGKNDTLLDSYGTKAQYLLMKEGPDASLSFLSDIEKKGSDLVSLDHTSWIEIYYQFANASEVKGDYTKGIEYVDQMFELVKEGITPPAIQARAYAMAARVYHAARKHKEGIKYGKLARDLYLEADPDTSNSYYAVLNTLASIYLFNSQYDSSINYSLQYLKGVKKIYGQNHFNVGAGYNQIASIHYNQNEYTEALEFFGLAEDVFQEYYENTGQDLYVNIIRTNLALVYLDLKEYELALDYALDVWPADLKNYGPKSPKLLYTLGRLVSIYHGMNDLTSAGKYVTYIEDILDANPGMTPSNKCYALNFILSQTIREDDLSASRETFNRYEYWFDRSGEKINKTYVSALSELAIAYKNHGKIDSAIILHKKCLSLYSDMFKPGNNAIFKEYLLIAECLSDSDPIVASGYLDSAMISRTYPIDYSGFTEAINLCDPSPLTTQAIKIKIELLYKNKDLFENSEASLLRIVSEYDRYIESYYPIIRTQSRISDLAAENDMIYAFAVMTLLDQGELEKAFKTAEKNRALSIRLALNQYASSEYAGIPENILTRESKLLAEINRQFIAKHTATISDSARTVAQMNYTDALDKYLLFIEELKVDFPSYYDLKYSLPDIDIDAIQAQLGPQTSIISYKYLLDDLYVFILSADNISHTKLNTENLDSEIVTLAKSLNTSEYRSDISRSLYKRLWEPIEMKITTEVIIIPDRTIHYLSFDLLEDPSSNFLIREYTTSYAIAADLIFKDNPAINNSKWVAFAPGFHDTLKQKYLEQRSDNIDSAYLYYLQQPQTTSFTSDLEEMGVAVIYQASEASELNFKNKAQDAPVIFLGTHAEVDDQRPNYSKLVFAKSRSKKIVEDGYLHTYEIYGKKINTDLAILTACNTGIGQIKNGEGILSISHSFAYAGCPSIVMTKWSVDETSSIKIIEDFIEKLKEGTEKNNALRQAKINFIKSNPALSANPYYWAGLTLIGDPTPLENAPNNNIVLYLVLGAFLLLVFVYLNNRYNR